MKPYPNNWIKLVLITLFQILISLFHLQISIASDLIPARTPSTGYQPQMQVSGDKIPTFTRYRCLVLFVNRYNLRTI